MIIDDDVGTPPDQDKHSQPIRYLGQISIDLQKTKIRKKNRQNVTQTNRH